MVPSFHTGMMRRGLSGVGTRTTYFSACVGVCDWHTLLVMNSVTLKAADLQRIGVSKPYAHQIARGHSPSVKMALRIMRGTGVKLGPIANLTDDQIAVLEAMHG